MCDPIAGTDFDRRGRDVDHRDLQLVARPAVVGVDDADAVGDHEAALERGAAAGEHGQEHLSRHLDHQAGWYQRHLAGGDDDRLGSSEVERRGAGGLIPRDLDVWMKTMNANGWHVLTIFQCQWRLRPAIMDPPTPRELT